MKRRASAVFVVMAAAAGTAAAMADAAHAQTWGGTLSVVSARVSRGLGLSGDHPGATADFFYRDDRNWALGLGLGTLNPDRGAKAEAIASATRWWQVDDRRTLTLSGAYYDYVGPGAGRLRYSEVSIGGLWDGAAWGQWGGTVSLSPDLAASSSHGYSAGHPGATIVELTWHRRLIGAVAADVGWGIVSPWGGEGSSYRFANGGLSYTAGAWRFAVSRLYSSVPPQQRWVAAVAWSF
ncbi:hypothetical protein [Roseateles sp. MS654]|uniref:hypothetical protein n=1 Tax=Roseateles sp. MS654 TaxID=3412685 RepID=UPI003C2F1142